MTDKRSDEGLIPAIKPDQDEVASYQRSGRVQPPKQSNFNGLLVFVIVLMAIVMGIGGYVLWEVQQRLEASNRLLVQAQQNVEDLRERLSAAGDTTSRAFQDMEEQIATNFAEIDKLWAVAYRRNRPNIEANTKAIGDIQATLNKDVAQLSSRMQSVTQEFEQFSSQMSQFRQSLQAENEEMLTEVALLRGQVQDQSVALEGNRRSIAALQQDMQSAQEAIDVIDQYRQRVNQQLLELRSQIQSGGGTTSPSTTAGP